MLVSAALWLRHFFQVKTCLRALEGGDADPSTERLVRWTVLPHQLFVAVLKDKNQMELTHVNLQNKLKPFWGTAVSPHLSVYSPFGRLSRHRHLSARGVRVESFQGKLPVNT